MNLQSIINQKTLICTNNVVGTSQPQKGKPHLEYNNKNDDNDNNGDDDDDDDNNNNKTCVIHKVLG